MNNKLKVIQLIDSLNAGGAEMMAVNIANELANENGIVSYLCTTRLEGILKDKLSPRVQYLFLNKKSRLDFRAIKKLNKFINVHQITTIHAHSSSYFMGFLMRLLNPELSLIWHNHYGNSKNLPFQKKIPLQLISKFFAAIISVNKILNEWALNYLKVPRSFYVPNFASFNEHEAPVTLLKGLKDKRMLCLANLRPEKDHLNLLKAFKIVHEKYSDWTLHLVGMDLLDKYSKMLKDYLKSNELNNHVFLYGSCKDTSFILTQTSIGVLSSKSEGLPVALLEYGLAKLPVVVTDVGECAKVVIHERSGMVVVPQNEEELAKAIEVLILNKNLRTVLSTDLYETIEMNYSKSNFIQSLISIYNID